MTQETVTVEALDCKHQHFFGIFGINKSELKEDLFVCSFSFILKVCPHLSVCVLGEKIFQQQLGELRGSGE